MVPEALNRVAGKDRDKNDSDPPGDTDSADYVGHELEFSRREYSSVE